MSQNVEPNKLSKDANLRDLVIAFFDYSYKQLKKKFSISEDVVLYDEEGREKFKFDLVIIDYTSNERIGVWIKDWKRPVGIDVYTRFKRAISKTKLTIGFLFANRLASGIQSREKENIFLLHRGELISMLKKIGYWKPGVQNKFEELISQD